MPASPASVSNEHDSSRRRTARILVVSVNWLGDCIMAMPALRRLRERLPGAHIAILSKPGVAGLWPLFKEVDETILLPPGIKGTLLGASTFAAPEPGITCKTSTPALSFASPKNRRLAGSIRGAHMMPAVAIPL